MTLSAGDVREVRFTRTSFREGYDPDEVDAFLERVATTLGAFASGRPLEAPLTREHVEAVRFRPTKFREGYDQDEVDDFLDLVAAALAEAARSAHESAPGRHGEHGPHAQPGPRGPRTVLEAYAAARGIDAATLRASVPPVTRRGSGYVTADVDAFLERAARALEDRRRGVLPELTAHEVRTVRFRAAGWRAERYDHETIDALLDRVEAALTG
ncbi:DivIVA domain-containing protein [Cellulomonas cellasea]|uniref:Cell wall synthesis protein Wag31 n=1 Tax=Cellulomonas cellasea TaxID=43670 RepID=A0A7W4UEU2_9CELL|nr:DivIVA domain-containing protein [Cellulomonas cellasea]MBB2922370.1 DivIVA domain-containing protein [Cellulomonas cellasea]